MKGALDPRKSRPAATVEFCLAFSTIGWIRVRQWRAQEQAKVARDRARGACDDHEFEVEHAVSGKRSPRIQRRFARQHRQQGITKDEQEGRDIRPIANVCADQREIVMSGQPVEDDRDHRDGRQAADDEDQPLSLDPVSRHVYRTLPTSGSVALRRSVARLQGDTPVCDRAGGRRAWAPVSIVCFGSA
jgi:hypothetical protein